MLGAQGAAQRRADRLLMRRSLQAKTFQRPSLDGSRPVIVAGSVLSSPMPDA